MRQHAEDLSDRVTWKLGLHYDVRQQVRETVLNLKEHMEGKPPKTIVAVALSWVVSHTRTITREEKMAIMHRSFEAVDITKATLENNSRKIEHLKRHVLPEALLLKN